MHLADMLKFFNRIGVRMVNDVTAQVTAERWRAGLFVGPIMTDCV